MTAPICLYCQGPIPTKKKGRPPRFCCTNHRVYHSRENGKPRLRTKVVKKVRLKVVAPRVNVAPKPPPIIQPPPAPPRPSPMARVLAALPSSRLVRLDVPQFRNAKKGTI